MSERSNSLIKNTTLLAFGVFCTKGIMFIMTPLFTRWLTKNDYGTFDLMVTYVTLLIPLLTLSSGEAIFRFLIDNKDDEYKKNVLSTAFVINLIGIFVSLIVGIICIIFFGFSVSITFAFLFYLIMEIIYHYFMMAMRGEGALNIYTLSNILFVCGLAFFVTIFVLILKMGLVGILLGYAIGDVISVFAICFISKENRKINVLNFSNRELKSIVKYSVPMIPNAISWWIVNASDRTLISFFLGTSFNAIYAVANKIPSLCNMFFSVFHLSWQQSATEALSDEDRDKYYCSVFNNMITIVISVCILILGFNFLFFKLFTADYYSGYYQAPILVLAILFSMMGQFIGGIYVAQMKTKKNGMTTVMAAIINIIVNFGLIRVIGLYAASISTLVAYMVLFFVRFVDIRKDMKLNIENKNFLALIVVLYFVLASYINSYAIKVINLIFGTVLFIIINYNLIEDYIKKFIKKIIKKKENSGNN